MEQEYITENSHPFSIIRINTCLIIGMLTWIPNTVYILHGASSTQFFEQWYITNEIFLFCLQNTALISVAHHPFLTNPNSLLPGFYAILGFSAAFQPLPLPGQMMYESDLASSLDSHAHLIWCTLPCLYSLPLWSFENGLQPKFMLSWDLEIPVSLKWGLLNLKRCKVQLWFMS